MSQLDKALMYADNGIKVFPCDAVNKNPVVRGGKGFKDATTDKKTIKKWWTEHPNALIGSPNDQFTVIDSDSYNLCPIGKLLNETAIRRLETEGVITDECMKVTTMSGGTHYYFKKNPMVSRSIKCLPSVDLLGEGGYVILPDQQTYKANRSEPWNTINKLPVFKHDTFAWLVDELDELNQSAKALKKDKKASKPATRKEPEQVGIADITKEMKRTEVDGKVFSHIDYETGEIHYIEVGGIYQHNEKEFTRADPNQKLLTAGKIQLKCGDINSEVIGALFHNKEIQTKLARFIGLKVTNTRTLQNSLLPSHGDKRASMGVRWSADGSHLIIRDFSNFYGSKYNQCDYNIVRLYATIRYKANVQRLSAAEFVIWFTRMLVESGIVSVDEVRQDYFKKDVKLTDTETKLVESFQLLDACKRLYKGYSGETTFSDKFASAWSGVGISTISRAKRAVIDKGLLEYTGVYDCSGGKRADGFYNTPLYKMVTEKPTGLNIKGVIKNKDVAKLKEQRRTQMNTKTTIQEATLTDKEKEVKSSYPDIGTIYKLNIAQDSYETLKNFCIDNGIDQIVSRRNMIVPILVSEDFIDDVIENKEMVYSLTNIKLEVDESYEESGKLVLIASGESAAFDVLWKEINDKHWDHKDDYVDEPLAYFVLSPDVSDVELDLQQLELKLNAYLNGNLKLTELGTKYMNVDQIDALLDGVEPEI